MLSQLTDNKTIISNKFIFLLYSFDGAESSQAKQEPMIINMSNECVKIFA